MFYLGDLMKNQKRIIITVLIVVEVISIFLTWKSYNAGKILENKVENNVTNEHFAFYVKENGEYKEKTDNTFPAGYHIDKNMTVCVDENKEKLDNIPVTVDEEGNITVTSNRTVYCTFYLIGNPIGDYIIDEMPKGLKKTTNPDDDLEYRFSGDSYTDVNNYICFGTYNRSDCIGEEEKYMYRIIGVDKDHRLKILKDSSIGTRSWNDEAIINAAWGKYEGLPEASLSSYLNNEWIKTLSNWADYIDNNIWNIGAVGRDSDYNDSSTIPGIASRIMEAEKSGILSSYVKSAVKIGLINLSDYYYAKDINGNTNCFYSSENYICKNWMNLEKAWTIIRAASAVTDARKYAWYVADDSIGIAMYDISVNINVYPVFYLKNDGSITYSSGDGSATNPFIIA